MNLMGWSWDQWAIAAARLGRPAAPVTLASALLLRRKWQLSNTVEPGEVQIIGVEIPMDHEFAAELFSIPACSHPIITGMS